MRTRRLELRITDEEREVDAAAAAAVGESLSEFFRGAAHARAEYVLAEQQRVSLTSGQARRFLDALEHPNELTVSRLRKLADRSSAFRDA